MPACASLGARFKKTLTLTLSREAGEGTDIFTSPFGRGRASARVRGKAK